MAFGLRMAIDLESESSVALNSNELCCSSRSCLKVAIQNALFGIVNLLSDFNTVYI